jgi:cytochrome oxidase Cu insertion factor (SCO1/SenC/PrrC family)
MRRPLLILVPVLLVVIVWRAWALITAPPRPQQSLEPGGEVADFKLTDRSEQPVGRDDLLGKVWVAGFAFTRCTGPCPQVTSTMARLQSEFKNEPDFRLVSVSVDPDHDTPDVLRKYANVFEADPKRWFFLTGPREDVYRLVLHSFHLGVQQNSGPDVKPGNEVTHSTRLALVDRKGRIRGYFEGRQIDETGQPTQELPKLRQAITTLLREQD